MVLPSSRLDNEDKAGYNQSQRITNTLSNLRDRFIEEKFNKNYSNCLEILISILNVISGKVSDNEIKEINEKIGIIEGKLPKAMQSFTNNYGLWIKNPIEWNEIRKFIDELHRTIEKLQDKYDYGMGSEKKPQRKVIN